MPATPVTLAGLRTTLTLRAALNISEAGIAGVFLPCGMSAPGDLESSVPLRAARSGLESPAAAARATATD